MKDGSLTIAVIYGSVITITLFLLREWLSERRRRRLALSLLYFYIETLKNNLNADPVKISISTGSKLEEYLDIYLNSFRSANNYNKFYCIYTSWNLGKYSNLPKDELEEIRGKLAVCKSEFETMYSLYGSKSNNLS